MKLVYLKKAFENRKTIEKFISGRVTLALQ